MKTPKTIQEQLNAKAKREALKELNEKFKEFEMWLHVHTLNYIQDIKLEDKSIITRLWQIEELLREDVVKEAQDRATKDFMEKVESLVVQVEELQQSIQ